MAAFDSSRPLPSVIAIVLKSIRIPPSGGRVGAGGPDLTAVYLGCHTGSSTTFSTGSVATAGELALVPAAESGPGSASSWLAERPKSRDRRSEDTRLSCSPSAADGQGLPAEVLAAAAGLSSPSSCAVLRAVEAGFDNGFSAAFFQPTSSNLLKSIPSSSVAALTALPAASGSLAGPSASGSSSSSISMSSSTAATPCASPAGCSPA
mmetsp:Transcript_54426/g.99702  ORF Transcript_54426/g.99702 Transcript_54426/m.99702 type:complete len:207 (+) Transcript_54426:647-1267(+)